MIIDLCIVQSPKLLFHILDVSLHSRKSELFFSRMRRRTALQYIKKEKKGVKSPQNKKVTGLKGL